MSPISGTSETFNTWQTLCSNSFFPLSFCTQVCQLEHQTFFVLDDFDRCSWFKNYTVYLQGAILHKDKAAKLIFHLHNCHILKKMTPLIAYYPVCITSWDHPFFFATSHSVLFVYVSRHAWQKEFFFFSFQILSTHPDDPSKARVNSPLLVTYHLREWDLLCFSTDSCLTWQCCNKWALTKCI